jgi:hypothetical protein
MGSFGPSSPIYLSFFHFASSQIFLLPRLAFAYEDMKTSRAIIFFALLLTSSTAQDPAQFVNPLVGTKDGGHVFSGATLPWGSVKAGADSNSPDGLAGYVSDGTPISGFSSL